MILDKGIDSTEGPGPLEPPVFAIFEYATNFPLVKGTMRMRMYQFNKRKAFENQNGIVWKVLYREEQLLAFLRDGNYSWTQLVFPYPYNFYNPEIQIEMRDRLKAIVLTVREMEETSTVDGKRIGV